MLSKVIVVFIPMILSRIVSTYFPMDQAWLKNLKQSRYTPPDEVFGPIWTILYFLIGWSIMKYPHDWLTLNLLLNFTWLIVFHRKSLDWSFLILMLMNLTLILYLKETQNWLLVPYLVWSLLATYLNGYLWSQNK